MKKKLIKTIVILIVLAFLLIPAINPFLDDAAKAADELRKKKAVILNMENVDKGLTRRVVDFLSGSIYALDGSVKKIAQSTYLFCPHNMDIVGDLESQIELEAFA